MPCYNLDDLTPVMHPGAFVHSTAVLMGDVIVDVRCSALLHSRPVAGPQESESAVDWDNLRFFLELSRTGRLTAAARRPGVDPTGGAARAGAGEAGTRLRVCWDFLREVAATNHAVMMGRA